MYSSKLVAKETWEDAEYELGFEKFKNRPKTKSNNREKNKNPWRNKHSKNHRGMDKDSD